MEADGRYPPKPSSLNYSRKLPFYPPPHHHSPYKRMDYADDESEEHEDEASDDESDLYNTSYSPRDGYPRGFSQSEERFRRYPKRPKLKALSSNYEFSPRNPRLGNFSREWSEHEKFVLLEVWGDRFLQLGRNNLRSEDWIEVAEKVSEMLRIDRTEAQCRKMVDVLKRKYIKEKAKGVGISKWGLFKKIDMLMKQEIASAGGYSLGCGLDAGEYVFTDTMVYLDRANGHDEMRDSPCETYDEEEEEKPGRSIGAKSLSMLADSVTKFREIYEKIESSKREQMMELERMKGEFERELEVQKKQIMDRAQAEIAKIREGDSVEIDGEDFDDGGGSAENVSE